MAIRVLGCSGGIGAGRRTTSFLIDGTILLDAGSGVGDLPLEEMARIGHIFLTHSHLDHVHTIPLLVDSVFDWIREPIVVYGLEETIRALKEHIFNWVIWPDFSNLPHPEKPVLRFQAILPGEQVRVGARVFEAVPVNHAVPTIGYLVGGATGVCAFSGDTTVNDTLWRRLDALERLDVLIVEAAFANAEERLCRVARHYSPKLLAEDLTKLRHDPAIFLTHAKPGAEERILEECRELVASRSIRHLCGGEVIDI